jgi:hypothetical protein
MTSKEGREDENGKAFSYFTLAALYFKLSAPGTYTI